MATQIPQARVVRKGGQLFAPPPEPPRARGPVGEQLYTLLSVAIGMWPLTAILILVFALLVLTGRNASY